MVMMHAIKFVCYLWNETSKHPHNMVESWWRNQMSEMQAFFMTSLLERENLVIDREVDERTRCRTCGEAARVCLAVNKSHIGEIR